LKYISTAYALSKHTDCKDVWIHNLL
jgi:hypothetical protein